MKAGVLKRRTHHTHKMNALLLESAKPGSEHVKELVLKSVTLTRSLVAQEAVAAVESTYERSRTHTHINFDATIAEGEEHPQSPLLLFCSMYPSPN